MQGYRDTESYKYNVLIAELRRKIFSGDFEKNGKLPTERKLAEIFGFSRITIRSALKQLKEEGLIEQTQGSGTFVKNLRVDFASKSEPQKTENLFICCVCLESNCAIEVDPYYSQIFLGFYRAAAKNGCKFETLQIPEGKKISSDIIKSSKYDGFIFINYSLQDSEIKYLDDLAVKYVELGENKSQRRVPMVDVDNFSGIYQAVCHLVETGKKQPLLLCSKTVFAIRRFAGYDAAIKDNGLEPVDELKQYITVREQKAVEEQLNKLIKQKIAFDSIIIVGDWATIGVINVLKKKKIRIPEDVSVITYDSFHWLISGIKPKLTSIRQPFAEMAEKAVHMLTNLCMNENNEIPITILKPVLEIRESTKINTESN